MSTVYTIKKVVDLVDSLDRNGGGGGCKPKGDFKGIIRAIEVYPTKILKRHSEDFGISPVEYTCIDSLEHLKRPSVVSVVTRLNISPAQQAALVIEESGGDISCIAK
ncbi:unnamed protein product [Lepeophtheirus salmonis]|uniref:(salmon louse) hypothetical protein n=1 Tax=Lepeophtheirus salmonis TaxID=72036 RepID=A0A7R8D257_LEPSM|nr:unnamed protein product [Lepeophtheirus salmonis]CAF2972480.1 unnamed protein product [Lepeophtheirus salmonis]